MAATNATQASLEAYLQQDRSGSLQYTAIAFIILTTITLYLRFRARQCQDVEWMWGDVFTPLSWVFCVALCVVALAAVGQGYGRHVESLSLSEITRIRLLSSFVAPCVYFLGVVSPKLAILDIYLFIFRARYMCLTCYAVAVVLVVNCVINLAVFLGKCRPIQANWSDVPGAHCLNVSPQVAAYSTIANILTDVVMVGLPIPMLIKLRRPFGVKVGIYFTFLIGNLGLATSIIRFVITWQLETKLQVDFIWWKATHEAEVDFTWTLVPETIISVAEPAVYHMAACMMTFRPLLQCPKLNKFVKSMVLYTTSLPSKINVRMLTSQSSSGRSITDGSHATIVPAGRDNDSKKPGTIYIEECSKVTDDLTSLSASTSTTDVEAYSHDKDIDLR